jgi:hypothetical protein
MERSAWVYAYNASLQPRYTPYAKALLQTLRASRMMILGEPKEHVNFIGRSCTAERGEALQQGSCCKGRNRAEDVARNEHRA